MGSFRSWGQLYRNPAGLAALHFRQLNETVVAASGVPRRACSELFALAVALENAGDLQVAPPLRDHLRRHWFRSLAAVQELELQATTHKAEAETITTTIPLFASKSNVLAVLQQEDHRIHVSVEGCHLQSAE
eukprot:CAMPEP_0175161944 /NCGR_PEP_ID=MMETSP0087-20121206/24884_1 /TAXON_ID=136419 /ORGANISM="Unknown Unknown, Strain D1" /LENGTH=131 /DNA_ID=CAMNT_0016450411 /DNA_START=157 /DNA_END=549 /DNA_ORIENTATION=+